MRVELQLKDSVAADLQNQLKEAQEALKSADDEKHKLTLELNTLQHKQKMEEA